MPSEYALAPNDPLLQETYASPRAASAARRTTAAAVARSRFDPDDIANADIPARLPITRIDTIVSAMSVSTSVKPSSAASRDRITCASMLSPATPRAASADATRRPGTSLRRRDTQPEPHCDHAPRRERWADPLTDPPVRVNQATGIKCSRWCYPKPGSPDRWR